MQRISADIFLEMVNGYLYPGKPIANMTFRIYGVLSIDTAVGAMYSFKQGHYMKIPPKQMFLVQVNCAKPWLFIIIPLKERTP